MRRSKSELYQHLYCSDEKKTTLHEGCIDVGFEIGFQKYMYVSTQYSTQNLHLQFEELLDYQNKDLLSNAETGFRYRDSSERVVSLDHSQVDQSTKVKDTHVRGE